MTRMWEHDHDMNGECVALQARNATTCFRPFIVQYSICPLPWSRPGSRRRRHLTMHHLPLFESESLIFVLHPYLLLNTHGCHTCVFFLPIRLCSSSDCGGLSSWEPKQPMKQCMNPIYCPFIACDLVIISVSALDGAQSTLKPPCTAITNCEYGQRVHGATALFPSLSIPLVRP